MQSVTAEFARTYLREAVKVSGLTLSEIARRAGLASTALTRPVNSTSYKGRMRLSTLTKVASVTRVPLPPTVAGPLSAANESRLPDAVQVAVLIGDAIPTGRALDSFQKSELTKRIVALLKNLGAVS